MAITTATIQVRRGLLKDFNPAKLRPGEWAVSVDIESNRQIVYMCFSAGVVKRMGTLEDFQEQIKEVTQHILQGYKMKLDDHTLQKIEEIKTYKDTLLFEVQVIKDEIFHAKDTIDHSFSYISNFDKELQEVLIPQINKWYQEVGQYVNESKRWAVGQIEQPETLKDNSKYYAEQSKMEYVRAKNEADRAMLYSGIVTPTFQVDFETMELIETIGSGIEFELSENKELIFKFTGGTGV